MNIPYYMLTLHAYRGAQGALCSYQLGGKLSDVRSAARTSISLANSQHQKVVVTVGSAH